MIQRDLDALQPNSYLFRCKSPQLLLQFVSSPTYLVSSSMFAVQAFLLRPSRSTLASVPTFEASPTANGDAHLWTLVIHLLRCQRTRRYEWDGQAELNNNKGRASKRERKRRRLSEKDEHWVETIYFISLVRISMCYRRSPGSLLSHQAASHF